MFMAHFIFVVGGVMSGIGKGVATASMARLLKSQGFKVTAIKVDPYLNVDAGTMNPIEHGEVFVTKDGVECDQDMGNYERFLDEDLTTDNYLTTGRVYEAVIKRERDLGYGGRCVEVVPDIPNEIIRRIKKAARTTRADFVLVEIGGTVGEYQNLLFLEAARMMKLQHPDKVLFVLITYLPIPKTIGEMKTKPAQQSVKWLNMAGIQPELIVARSREPLDTPRKRKLSIFCNLTEQDIVSAPDIASIYKVPLFFEKEKVAELILKKFRLRARRSDLKGWKRFVRDIELSREPLRIGVVGKYFETGSFVLLDVYISIIEALKQAAWRVHRKPKIIWLSAGKYEPTTSSQGASQAKRNLTQDLDALDGVVVPGGFGARAGEGKIKAIEYCRKNKIPYLGLCLGMQMACIEFARNVCGLKGANSTEFDTASPYPVIDVMPEQKRYLREKSYGGTMRLGEYECRVVKGTKSFSAYKKARPSPQKQNDALLVSERHRHRYEFNNEFRELFEKKGMVFAGINPERNLVEIIELKDHPFFVATQFHPEFKSRPLNPHPLFNEFIRVSKNINKKS